MESEARSASAPEERESGPPPPLVTEEPGALATPAARPAETQPSEPSRPTYVYALGQIEPRFPNLGIEKEFTQAGARIDSTGLNDRQAFRAVITDPANRYLVRHLCWVFLIQQMETYILVPRDPADYGLLVEAFRENPSGDDIDVVIGVKAQIAPADMCNGLAVPIVVFDQVYSFDRTSLMNAITVPPSVGDKQIAAFRQTATSLFDEIRQMADNAGATDEHRALNYLTVRYSDIYGRAHRSPERELVTHGSGRPRITAERSARGGRSDLLLHPPPDRRHGSILSAS